MILTQRQRSEIDAFLKKMGELPEFSMRTRAQSLRRFSRDSFDFLVVGGGITGAAVARDLVSRGYAVALVEKDDFASGTSSRSSKLIHGGLRYLENLEFHLVFEALAERALLLKSSPQLVRPLPFYFPVYQGDRVGKNTLDLGLWLYDLLTLFRTPKVHSRLSKDDFLRDVPFLDSNRFLGGFKYYDASMWDDVYTVEVLRSASSYGAAVANGVCALSPIKEGKSDRVRGFRCLDRMTGTEFNLKARNTILCLGPWSDLLGEQNFKNWKPLLKPSRGVHLIFDWKRIPVPGAVVMSEPTDGRISFVMPRHDLGGGVTIVGTTDGPSPKDPEKVEIQKEDVVYLMGMINRYFPSLEVKLEDIVSGYVGVRPLFAPPPEGGAGGSLQKVSREHHLELGPGHTVWVTGGKYTTHRRMAEEIVEFALEKSWDGPRGDARIFRTQEPVNKMSLTESLCRAQEWALRNGIEVPECLWSRYGAEALRVLAYQESEELHPLPHFNCVQGRLQFALTHEMILTLSDFYLRRLPIYASRKDHGKPWISELAGEFNRIVFEMGFSHPTAREVEDQVLQSLNHLETWREKLI